LATEVASQSRPGAARPTMSGGFLGDMVAGR
jgi:hypothetical protein